MTDDRDENGVADTDGPTHHGAQFVFAVASFGFALFLAANIPWQTEWAKRLDVVRQPAFWPTVAITAMAGFGALELWFCLRRNRERGADGTLGEVRRWLGAAEYVGWFMVYVWLVPQTGYFPTTLVFTGALTLRLGYRSPATLAAALLTGATTVVVFKSFLGVRIPGGAIYEFLPPALRNFMILYL